ncbi:hypothetical protein ACFWWT_21325 [Streptomyces sp. NPDC058676]|uniref:hypothetical protein n=1 Tax=unclassified Streptomyces TaxID=2593676 RepID=UPI003664CE3B
MTTVTLPTVPPPPQSRAGTGRLLPLPGRYTVAPGRSLVELTAWYGPLPTRRRRVALTGASLTVSDPRSDIDPQTVLAEADTPLFRLGFDGPHLEAEFTSERVDESDGRLQLTGDLDLDGVAFPVLLRLRVVERADDRLLAVGTARLPYRLLRRATGFRLPWRLPATRLRLLVAAEFA